MPQLMNYGDYIGKMVEKMRLSKGVGTCAGVVRVPDAYSGFGENIFFQSLFKYYKLSIFIY